MNWRGALQVTLTSGRRSTQIFDQIVAGRETPLVVEPGRYWLEFPVRSRWKTSARVRLTGSPVT